MSTLTVPSGGVFTPIYQCVPLKIQAIDMVGPEEWLTQFLQSTLNY